MNTCTAFSFSSDKNHHVRHVQIRQHLVAQVKCGQKILLQQDSTLQIRQNELFTLLKDSRWEMINRTLQSHYQANIIHLSNQLITLFYQYYPQFKTVESRTAKHIYNHSLSDCFQRTWDSLRTPELSSSLKQHRTLELLLQLAEQGIVFPLTEKLSWADKMQALVEQNLSHPWTMREIAHVFHLSESTLKRRLLQENIAFRQWLQALRLDTALALILSSEYSLAEIAYRCGYQSQSRFSAAFKQHFNLLPSHIKSR